MPHIHTGAKEHDLTVTAYIIRTDGEEPVALLHMHKKLHMLLPVGGHVELVETPWQAIAHETEEEAGYTFDQLYILQPVLRIKTMSKVNQHPYPVSMNTHNITPEHLHTDIEYAFITRESPQKKISENESADIRWVSRSELEALGLNEIYENTKQVYRFIFDEILSTWEEVATKEFLLEFPDNYLG